MARKGLLSMFGFAKKKRQSKKANLVPDDLIDSMINVSYYDPKKKKEVRYRPR